MDLQRHRLGSGAPEQIISAIGAFRPARYGDEAHHSLYAKPPSFGASVVIAHEPVDAEALGANFLSKDSVKALSDCAEVRQWQA